MVRRGADFAEGLPVDVGAVERVRELVGAKDALTLAAHLKACPLPALAVLSKAHPSDGLSAFLYACFVGAGAGIINVLLGT